MGFPISPIFIPANRLEWVEKVNNSNADGIIFDLEDAIPNDEKDSARNDLFKFLEQHNTEITYIIRINDLKTEAGVKDLDLLRSSSLINPLIMVPKIEGPEDLSKINLTLRFIALIESPLGLRNLKSIADEIKVEAFAFGPADMSKSLGSSMDWSSLLFYRTAIILESSIKNIHPIDGHFMDVSSENGLREECKLSKSLGFKSKIAIHPSQVDIIREIFLPSSQEIREAKDLIKKFYDSGKGVISIDGQMIDKPLVEIMEKKLILAGLDPKKLI